jgi:hypothetical protein
MPGVGPRVDVFLSWSQDGDLPVEEVVNFEVNSMNIRKEISVVVLKVRDRGSNSE